jgi:hypothetical protein
VTAGVLTSAERDQFGNAIATAENDPLRSAIDGLVRDQLIVAAASQQGSTPHGDVNAEVRTFVASDLGVRVHFVTFAEPFAPPRQSSGDWPPPPGADSPTAAATRTTIGERLAATLREGTEPADAVAGLTSVGWRAWGGERWLPTEGPVDGLPPGFVTATRKTSLPLGSTIGPAYDRLTGIAAVGAIVESQPPSLNGPVDTVLNSGIDASALTRWADARAAERAVRSALRASWATEPQPRVRVSEIVVGSADLQGAPGPYVSFAHLVVNQLPAADRPSGTDTDAIAIAAQLRAMSAPDRESRFIKLIQVATRIPAADPFAMSGELGYFTRDQLLPELATPAFAAGARAGDIIGPVTTAVGPELFILRGRFDGVLDERANAALVEARSTNDPAALARRIAPAGESQRADGTLWRAMAEFGGNPAAYAAYGETALDAMSEPFVLDGEIVVIRVDERQSAVLDADTRARLDVSGFDRWLAERLAAATIVRDPEPLPGVHVGPDASASPPLASEAPIETPNLPNVSAPGHSSEPFPIPTPPVIP